MNSRTKFHFRSRDGKSLDVFRVDELIERKENLLIRLKKAEDGSSIILVISRAAMRMKGITREDINEAPGVVLPRDRGLRGETEVSFISAKRQSVIAVAASVVES